MKTIREFAGIVRNGNRIIMLAAFWLVWLLTVVSYFAGSYAVYAAFFVGMGIVIPCAAWVLDHQNAKEKAFLEKMGEALFD